MDTMSSLANGLPNNHFRNDTQGDRTSWEYHTVSVTRVSGYGFGIAVSGGRDNPHFANGDPSIAVSDVLKGGPAEERLQVNDRIISVNGVSLENVEYATAVQVLRDSGNTVTLMVKRRVPHMGMNMMPPSLPAAMVPGMGGGHHHQLSHISNSGGAGGGIGSGLGVYGSTPGIAGINPSMGQHQQLQQQQQQQQQQLQQQQQQYLKLVLSKTSKKEDFGIVLGCRLFIKEISAKARDQLALNGYTLQEGDIVTRLHNTNTNDAMSLKEARKIMDGCKERLNLAVLRDIAVPGGGAASSLAQALPVPPQSPVYSHTAQPSNCSNLAEDPSFYAGPAGPASSIANGASAANNSYSAQNLYVQPPTRPSGGQLHDDKSNLTPRGRSRNPLMDVSLLQLDRPSTPRDLPPAPSSANTDGADLADPPRPPPPREEDFYASRRQLYEEDPLRRAKQSAEPRFISFQKEGSVGIRLTGGNEAGIFVTAVQPGSPASLQGLTPGDKILKVNDMDMAGVTREEAVLFLLSLQDRIDLIVQHCREEYDHAVANQRGDSFHIKTHFHCENPTKGEMSFRAGDIFRVVDTLHNGVVGAWQVLRIGRGQQEIQRGVIPNKARAEELATAQFNASKKEANSAESRTSFFRRRRPTHRRSKSLSRENWDDVVFSDSSISKFPAYERVVLRHPGFVRPVVMFGPVADLARERLIKDFPDKFTAPAQGVHHGDDGDDGDKSSGVKCGIVRLSNIRDIMDRGKHALLDITPNAVDRLNYAQFYPIVVFLKADNKHQIKQLRQGIPKSVHKSSKKLLDQCQKMDRVWSHVFSGVLMLNDADTWYRKLRDTIDQLQSGAIWMSENKPVESLSDDFLFPMNTTSRLSYASSPESDLEMSPGPSTSLSLGNLPQLVKSNSDPSIATNQDLLERDRELAKLGDEALPPPYSTNGRPPAVPTTESKYGFTGDDKLGTNATGDPSTPGKHSHGTVGGSHLHHHTHSQSITSPGSGSGSAGFYGKVPELPPRIDRASKPPGGYPNSPPPAPTTSARPPMSPDHNGTFHRPSAQDRLFSGAVGVRPDGHIGDAGVAVDSGLHDDALSTGATNPQNSLDRSVSSSATATNAAALMMSPKRAINGSGAPGAYPPPPPPANGSYDSVSSYDEAASQQRLGPNAPDDLKSVPAASLSSRLNDLMIANPNGDTSTLLHHHQHPHQQQMHHHLHSPQQQQQQQHLISNLSKRPSMHEHSRTTQAALLAAQNGRQSSPGRPPFVGASAAGPPLPGAPPGTMQHPGLSLMQRPNHLGLDGSMPGTPTKKLPQPGQGGVETKTDYGKYSRNNSASQADYAMRAPGSPQIGTGSGSLGVPPLPGSNGVGVGGAVPFKPVPPPKPKNYHPPVQHHQQQQQQQPPPRGGPMGNSNGYWENGAQMETSSPRSPNGFYYPPAPSHYHHNQSAVGGAPGHMPPPPTTQQQQQQQQHLMQQQQQHLKHGNPYGQYPAASHYNGNNGANNGSNAHLQQQQQQSPSYGYHGGAGADYQAHHRAAGMGKSVPPLPPGNHPSERSALDLAGSREQRGSAFELYRKPQIGNVGGHHHNMSDMESTSSANSNGQFRFANDPAEDRYYGSQQQQHQNHHQYHQQHPQYAEHPQHPNEHYAPHNHGQYMPQRPTSDRHPIQAYGNQNSEGPPPLPPPLKPKKKLSMLRSPFSALKKAFTKSTKPLRRQNSMLESSSSSSGAHHRGVANGPSSAGPSASGGLRRQHSMLEPSRPAHFAGTPDMSGQRRRHYYSEEPQYMARHEAFRPSASGDYQNMNTEAIYGNCGALSYYDRNARDDENDERMYANRNAMVLQQPPAQSSSASVHLPAGGRRIVRRHSMADRHGSGDMAGSQRGRSEPRSVQAAQVTAGGRYDVPPSTHQRAACRYDIPPPPEPVGEPGADDIYQTRSGAYMMDTVVAARRQQQQQQLQEEAIYQSRREMHRDHLYQSRAEMQQRLQQVRAGEAAAAVAAAAGTYGAASGGGGSSTQSHSSSVASTPLTPSADAMPDAAIYGTRSEALFQAESASGSTGSQSPSGGRDAQVLYQSRRELKERGFKTRTQLRDHIYQSRMEAMQSMAEPVYVSRREMRPEPIYEARESQCLDGHHGGGVNNVVTAVATVEVVPTSPQSDASESMLTPRGDNDMSLKDVIDHLDNGFIETSGQQLEQQPAEDDADTTYNDSLMVTAEEDLTQADDNDSSADEEDMDEDTLTNNHQSNQSDLQKTIIAAANQQAAATAAPGPAPLTPRSMRDPYHISNMIKRTAPVPSPTLGKSATTTHDFDTNHRNGNHALDPHASRTSIETQFTCTTTGASLISLPTGPPNAQSTPYASHMTLPPPPPPQRQGPGGNATTANANQSAAATAATPAAANSAAAETAGAAGNPPLRDQTTTRGVFDANGGTLCDNVWNVSVHIPAGAIPPGVQQELYFTVTDPRMSQVVGGPPLDMENGETMLSPLVMCGPQGIEFLRPVTLNIPHCAGRTMSLGLAVKATDTERLHDRTSWDNIDLPSTAAAHTVSVQVDHF